MLTHLLWVLITHPPDFETSLVTSTLPLIDTVSVTDKDSSQLLVPTKTRHSLWYRQRLVMARAQPGNRYPCLIRALDIYLHRALDICLHRALDIFLHWTLAISFRRTLDICPDSLAPAEHPLETNPNTELLVIRRFPAC